VNLYSAYRLKKPLMHYHSFSIFVIDSTVAYCGAVVSIYLSIYLSLFVQ